MHFQPKESTRTGRIVTEASFYAGLRALETGRWLLRATTNGVSAIIDQRGQVRGRSPQFQTHVLTGEARPYRGATPYVRFGNLPVLMLALAAVLMSIRFWRRRPD